MLVYTEDSKKLLGVILLFLLLRRMNCAYSLLQQILDATNENYCACNPSTMRKMYQTVMQI